LVAAFFATSEIPDRTVSRDFAIYAYESNYYLISKPKPIPDPFGIVDEYVEVHADHYSDRMAAQRGFFTLHKEPDKPFREKTLMKFQFPAPARKRVLNELDFYGVNRSSLFPGLDRASLFAL
jgi:hypothetical protein